MATRKHTTKTKARNQRIESAKLALIGARAAVDTAVAVLMPRRGLDEQVATNLMRGASLPICEALAELEVLS